VKGERESGYGAGNGGRAGACHPGEGPQQRIVAVLAPVGELASDCDHEHRYDHDQDLQAEQARALGDERESRGDHDEQQRSQGLRRAGREEAARAGRNLPPLIIRSRLMETATNSSPVRPAAAAITAVKNGSQAAGS